MSMRRGPRSMKNSNSGTVSSSAWPVSLKKVDARVPVLAIEQALAELGIHAPLSDLVRRAQVIETTIMQSRSRRKPEHLC
jgi:hypothetical protein